ncbi:threonyl-tRNA synthetase [Nocardia farcinica]|uniref:Threonine--tRNA ligase n=1 Tax=Nocardia farcinica TaxID=37329 RepID=A0A0H5NRP6_NOCFR|nr:threonine--tRNA ligase [Nocardia farcinica]AXK85927.1 threonine--tRNA ligase [Nocardia farcinica]CRY78047.1 Threonine--tRNA ligase [Nocardia farcinica]SIS88454.1 threonyl-tRNA synthetase [Nocardia farcinica]
MYDHRKLGRELDLFDSDPLIGSGLPYWLPSGGALRHALEEYIRTAEHRAGYRHVHSPVLGKRELYEISGHWAHYREDMYPPMDVGGEQVVLRPSLCPHHALIYRSRSHSYRELPLRMAELGVMYRAELSGVLGGLSRVRAIHLNDAHIFCTEDQVGAEVHAALAMIARAHAALGIAPHRFRLSLPGPGGKYVPNPAMWERATGVLVEALRAAGIDYEPADDEAAFYGPKIDVQFLDSAGREFTLSTVQVDFHQPEQFDLCYIGADGAKHRPVMVHRSIIGSVERAVAHLVEVHGGAFPVWLAPTQVVVLPLSGEQHAAAEDVVRVLRAADVRAELAGHDQGSLGARIRAGRQVPYQVVVGPKEVAAGTLAVRLRSGEQLAPLPVSDFLARVDRVVRAHAAEL